MKSTTRHIACFCENVFDAQVPESANLAEDPDVEGLILGGDFGAVSCPACGKRLTPEFPFRLTVSGEWGRCSSSRSRPDGIPA